MNLAKILLLNFLINLIVIKTTAMIVRERGDYFVLSAFLGAGLTTLRSILHLSFLGGFVYQLGCVCLYVCLSFKFCKFINFLRIYTCYYVSTIFYAGVCYYLTGYFSLNSVVILLFSIFAVFLILKVVFAKLNRKRNIDNFCCDVVIENENKIVECKAFLDSGNMLFDPITDSPVCLVNTKTFLKIFDDISQFDIVTNTKRLRRLRHAHYIDFKTLTSCKKMLVFEVEKLCVGEKVYHDAVLGLCLKDFNLNFETDLILHNRFAGI